MSEDTHSLAKYGIKESGSEVRCKDLGPQIAWRTVFLAEYVSKRSRRNDVHELRFSRLHAVRTHSHPAAALSLVHQRPHSVWRSAQSWALFPRSHSRIRAIDFAKVGEQFRANVRWIAIADMALLCYARTVLALIVLHYVKREYETVFVHKFSHATMPFRNIFKK